MPVLEEFSFGVFFGCFGVFWGFFGVFFFKHDDLVQSDVL